MIATVSFPFCVGICPALFSKVRPFSPTKMTEKKNHDKIITDKIRCWVLDLRAPGWDFSLQAVVLPGFKFFPDDLLS